MKRLIPFLLLAAIITGCSTSRQAQRYTNVVDYSKYPDMFITESNSVSFEYTPLGSVSSTFLSGQTAKRVVPGDDVYLRGKVSSGGVRQTSTRQETLTILVNEVKKLGGNGIINLEITTIDTYEKGIYEVLGYNASGMAIIKKP